MGSRPRSKMTPVRRRRFVRAALGYLALSGVWIYGVLDRGLHEGDQRAWWVIGAVLLAHVAFGFVVREWVALLLPIGVVLLAMPAGYPVSEFSEPAPLFLGQIFLVQLEVPLIALGLGLRSLADKRRSRQASTVARWASTRSG
jgi:hypothetical protein